MVNWVVFQKLGGIGVQLFVQHEGLVKDLSVYYKEGWSLSHSHGVPMMIKWGVPMGVASVGAIPRGLIGTQ